MSLYLKLSNLDWKAFQRKYFFKLDIVKKRRWIYHHKLVGVESKERREERGERRVQPVRLQVLSREGSGWWCWWTLSRSADRWLIYSVVRTPHHPSQTKLSSNTSLACSSQYNHKSSSSYCLQYFKQSKSVKYKLNCRSFYWQGRSKTYILCTYIFTETTFKCHL